MCAMTAPDDRAELARGVPALELEGLTFRYGDVVAVNELSLEIPAGAVAGLIGPNGSGKTTTLRLITGILERKAGSVTVQGHLLASSPIQVKRRLAYAPDAPSGFDHLTVREYLELYGGLQGADQEYAERAENLLGAMDLLPHAHRLLGKLSHGTRRKVSIVAAIALVRPVLLLDEATSALDPESVAVLEALLRSAVRYGSSALVATQDIYFAERTCDLVFLMAGGRLRASGSPADLRRKYDAPDLREAFMKAAGLTRMLEGLDELLAPPERD